MTTDIPILRCDGPLLIFGGCYSNLEATQAVFAEAGRLGIPPDRMICTGDVVAYGADASATARLVRATGCHLVMGNCEESLSTHTDDCGCGFPENSSCQRLANSWFSHADRTLDSDLRLWMAELPRRTDVEMSGIRLAVVHGSAGSINRFIFASTPIASKIDDLDLTGTDGVIGGHCGLPFTQAIGARLWHNAGAIGMPANDGTRRVWFSIVDTRDEGIAIEHRALEYDFQTAADKIRQAGLPQDYAAALETGLWPGCDMLPLKEIRERGVALEERSVLWQPPATPTGRRKAPALQHLWPSLDRDNTPALSTAKFDDPVRTAAGDLRASVSLKRLQTLWFNTGTLCNITCRNCYIESSPTNDRLAYIRREEVLAFLDEIATNELQTEEIGLTGGEPFMNPNIIGILEDCLAADFKVLVLTNALRPIQRHKQSLLRLNRSFGSRLTIRVSLDHHTAERHEEVRGPKTFAPALSNLKWLCDNGFNVSIAGRTMWGEDAASEKAGYVQLLSDNHLPVSIASPGSLILFPEMEPGKDVPEITTACWDILQKSPDDVMCSSSRMVVKRKDAERPTVLACTLLPYDEEFELGHSLAEASCAVPLNHQFCSQFCVLGGSSCSGK